MHSSISRNAIYGEHPHLDVSVQFVIERPAMYCLRLGYVEQQNLFHSVTLDDDIDPSHSYAPNLPGSLSDLCGHDEWRWCSTAGKDCRAWS